MTNTFFPTSHKDTVHDYPYGRLQCTRSQWVEFKPKEGFRHVTQTVNPKTGRLNAPKKSTYVDVMVLYLEEKTGYLKPYSFRWYELDKLNERTKWMEENADLFTVEQRQEIYAQIITFLRATIQSSIVYCGSKFEDLKPLFETAMGAAMAGFKDGGNTFGQIKVDAEAVKAAEVPDFKPFK